MKKEGQGQVSGDPTSAGNNEDVARRMREVLFANSGQVYRIVQDSEGLITAVRLQDEAPAEIQMRTIAPTASEKIRMSLDLTPEMKAVIDDLAQRDGSTRADLLRRAVALLKSIKDAEAEGLRPALIDQEGNVEARLVGI